MTSTAPSLERRGFGATSRPDGWWVKPLLVFLGLTAFIVYSTLAAFRGDHFLSGHLLSPMYSPLLFGHEHAWISPDLPSFWPSFLPWSPAFLILWAPAGFRLTCYYYRGAYYKAFWADPPACAVSEPRKSYLGENSLPLILQNVHRYFMYLAVVFIFLLTYDAIDGFFFDVSTADASLGREFGVSVGSLVLTTNAVLLGGYTFGCHSLRHVVGGFLNTFSQSPARHKAWKCVTCLNVKHQLWAWMSLFWVGFTDFYVWMCASGTWTDWRVF